MTALFNLWPKPLCYATIRKLGGTLLFVSFPAIVHAGVDWECRLKFALFTSSKFCHIATTALWNLHKSYSNQQFVLLSNNSQVKLPKHGKQKVLHKYSRPWRWDNHYQGLCLWQKCQHYWHWHCKGRLTTLFPRLCKQNCSQYNLIMILFYFRTSSYILNQDGWRWIQKYYGQMWSV